MTSNSSIAVTDSDRRRCRQRRCHPRLCRLATRAGTVTLAFTNEGDVTHQAVVGDERFQEEHEAEMEAMAGDGTDEAMTDTTAAMDEDMEGMDHNADNALSLEPGESGEITYTFEEAGNVLIACHEP
jgi:uncharacterized cupredoxin-like copper-binding protein